MEYCQINSGTTFTGDIPDMEDGLLPFHMCLHQPTLKLRFLQKKEGKKILQQGHWCKGCDDFYWEDIPIEIEGEENDKTSTDENEEANP
jgi:hypothetical protein